MEISVALLLAALLMAVSIPALQSVAATQLRKSAGQLAGMSREAYARAAISGKPHRIVVDLDSQTFWMENASGFFVLGAERSKQLTEAEVENRRRGILPVKTERAESNLTEEERLKAKLDTPVRWDAVDDELGKPQSLPHDCEFEKVWVAHQSEAFVRGQSMIHYWPAGYAEKAIIRLTDDPEKKSRVISVTVNGLTGRSSVLDRAVEIPSS